ncbi:DUF3108 domain-containing protein [Limnohabitans sp. G3-2]|uniref:DUF3108 domain-containing protein n=1 Tax=Limnohabitans sp. G3-2 TaxID=1100711 RepID=UPI000C1DE419|nr:DUF3108 domain-containing protein [Limnohabitans sp. G3-2]PIT72167.1 hypothetical protein B9Z31_13805 [Limnohabitans sp. G3-2]
MTQRPDPTARIAPKPVAWQLAPPSRRRLAGLVLTVLALHLALLWGMTGSLDGRLPTDEAVRVAPLQTRWIPPVSAPVTSPSVAKAAQPRTRIATVPKAPSEPVLVPSPESPSLSSDASVVEPPLEASGETSTPAQTMADSTANIAAATTAATTAETPRTETITEAAPTPSSATTPQAIQTTPTALPPIPAGALPPSLLLSYKMTGQEKGLNYFANGELRWQHNDAAYALSLSVRAFLMGSRHWRSVGEINETGLAPRRFSDSWRNERAAHFDRANQRVVFSNNAPIALLEAGAQDQISLYVQLAAAMAGAPQRFEPGTRLQVQTATIKDALPWLLTLGANETLQLNGQSVATAKWVCQPRNRFDATVEFWVSAQHAWMPVRIKITQVSGSYIDLMLSDQEALPTLPALPTPVSPGPNSPVPAG